LINPETSNWDCFQSKTSLFIQGACADGIKLALSEIHKQLPRSTWIIAIVDDEIIVEASEAKAERVKKILIKIMVSIFDRLFNKLVPIEVNARIRKNWG
jgi:DNA polymerase I-like protein with 3'-5' exonuclease and polymerase domains